MVSVNPVEPISAQPPMPPRVAVNLQTWADLTFVHWRVDPKSVQAMLPRGLTVDRFEGDTWLGVVPFYMTGVRTPPLPVLGSAGEFPELNARVYVSDDAGHRGVWFLRLWCASRGFTAMARALGVPYTYARGSVERTPAQGATNQFPYSLPREVSYRFQRDNRRTDRLQFAATITAGERIERPTDRDHWLTARWNMFATRAGVLWRYRVHHEPWELYRADVSSLVTNVHECVGLPLLDQEPLVHQARAVHSRVAVPRRSRTQ